MLSLFSRFIFVFLIDMPYATDFFTTNVLFALAFGGGLAYLHVFKASLAFKIAKNRFYLPISILTYIIFSVFFHYYGFSTYFPLFDQFLFSIVMFFVVAKASTSDFTGIFKWLLTNKYSIYLGKISYGLYVFHWPIYIFLNPFFKNWSADKIYFVRPEIASSIITLTIAIFLSLISQQYFESIFIRLKKKF